MTSVPGRLPWTPALVRVMAGLMLSLFVAAMDSTVVGTALPTISRELGQFQLYPFGAARDPMTARAQLAAGLHADFEVITVLVACILAVSLVILRTAKREAPVGAPRRAAE